MNERFLALDGLRGIAAIAVVIYHFAHNWPPGTWVAVDMFFILSGFVLMHGQSSNIQTITDAINFMKVRLIRLVPLSVLGTAIGACVVLLKWSHGDAGSLTGAQITAGVARGILMVPDLGVMAWPSNDGIRADFPYPLNPPTWTLFFELLVNGCFALYLVVFGLRTHGWVAAALMLALTALQVITGRTNIGWDKYNFVHWGLLRVVAEFYLGMFLWSHRDKAAKLSPWIGLGLTAAFFLAFLCGNRSANVLNAMVVAPLLVFAVAKAPIQGWMQRALPWLGDLSFPLYMTHLPLIGLLNYLLPMMVQMPLWPRVAMESTTALLFAALLVPVDRRLRRWLVSRLRRASR